MTSSALRAKLFTMFTVIAHSFRTFNKFDVWTFVLNYYPINCFRSWYREARVFLWRNFDNACVQYIISPAQFCCNCFSPLNSALCLTYDCCFRPFRLPRSLVKILFCIFLIQTKIICENGLIFFFQKPKRASTVHRTSKYQKLVQICVWFTNYY